MKHLILLTALALSSLNAAADPQAVSGPAGPNPVADPFTANSKVELPPVPPARPPGIELPVVPFLKSAQPLPQSLRVILIRDQGQGLLGSAEAGASSIPVANGKPVRIAGQNYHVEVTNTEIRLYSSKKGALIWEGSLAGVAPVTVQSDAAQVKYTPPLSAGVSPGLKSTGTSGTASQPIIRVLGTQ